MPGPYSRLKLECLSCTTAKPQRMILRLCSKHHSHCLRHEFAISLLSPRLWRNYRASAMPPGQKRRWRNPMAARQNETEPGLLCRTHGGVCCQLEEFGRAAVNALGDSGDFRRRCGATCRNAFSPASSTRTGRPGPVEVRLARCAKAE